MAASARTLREPGRTDAWTKSTSITASAGQDSGQRCEKDISFCQSQPCLNNANCINLLGNFFCACPSGTDGKRCETAPDRCIGDPYINDGQYRDFGSGLNCTCDPDYVGVNLAINDGQWHHIALVWDGPNGAITLTTTDGVIVGRVENYGVHQRGG